MITLAVDCLLFRLSSGESITFSAEMISVELLGDTAQLFDPEFVRHAANAVFHYFKHELGRQSVSVGEFAGALEKVLRGFQLKEACLTSPNRKSKIKIPKSTEVNSKPLANSQLPPPHTQPPQLESDLCQLARESGLGCELIFFPRLRHELHQQLRQGPRVLRFRGLRGCVKQLLGVRRWNPRCRDLQEQIVAYLRECLSAEARQSDFALVVE